MSFTVAFDIDETLADILPLMQEGHKWIDIIQGNPFPSVRPEMRRILENHVAMGDEVIIISSRPMRFHEETLRWIHTMVGDFPLYLWDGEYLPGPKAYREARNKEAIIARHGLTIDIAYDNNRESRDVYRQNGAITPWPDKLEREAMAV